MSSTDDDEVVAYLQTMIPYQYCLIAGTVLLLYDTCLTLSTEINVVWHREFSLVSLLHVINRYSQLAAYASAVALLFPVSDRTCNSLGWFEAISTMVPYVAWALFAGFRVYALSNRNTVFAALVFLLNGAYIMPDIYEDTHASFVNSPFPYGCYQDSAFSSVSEGLLWSSRAALLLGESIVLVWTLKKTYQARRPRQSTHRPSTLTDVVLNYGMACFSVPLLLNATTLALDVGKTESALVVGQCIVAFRDALTTNLISRFLLKLGSLRTHTTSSEADRSEVESEGGGALTTHFSSDMSDVTFVLPDIERDSC